MDFKAKTRTEQILTVMYWLAWVAFIGFLIEAGTLIAAYGVSVISPELAKNFPGASGLSGLRVFNIWHYTLSMSFIVAFAIFKAVIAYLVIRTLSTFNLNNPFTKEVAEKLETISEVAFGSWIVVMLNNAHAVWLLKNTGDLHGKYISGEFIFMVGLVYIISQVFKRGVEIQTDNDLTV